MAAAPESVQEKWRILDRHPCVLPADVWTAIEQGCLCQVSGIEAAVRRAGAGDLPVDDARMVAAAAAGVRTFIMGIGIAGDGRCRLEGGAILLERNVLDLVRHYVCNDLYKIVLVADAGEPSPQPIPARYAGYILAAAREIRDFWNELRRRTR